MLWRTKPNVLLFYRLKSAQIFTDPWSTLNIKRDATREEVKNAFVHLARIHHPDNNPTSDTGTTHYRPEQQRGGSSHCVTIYYRGNSTSNL